MGGRGRPWHQSRPPVVSEYAKPILDLDTTTLSTCLLEQAAVRVRNRPKIWIGVAIKGDEAFQFQSPVGTKALQDEEMPQRWVGVPRSVSKWQHLSVVGSGFYWATKSWQLSSAALVRCVGIKIRWYPRYEWQGALRCEESFCIP